MRFIPIKSAASALYAGRCGCIHRPAAPRAFHPAVEGNRPHFTLLTPPEQAEPDLIISGQDVVLDILANLLQQESMNAARSYLSSLEGLLSMYQGKIHVVACHLHNGEQSNASFVRRLMPGVPAVLVNLS